MQSTSSGADFSQLPHFPWSKSDFAGHLFRRPHPEGSTGLVPHAWASSRPTDTKCRSASRLGGLRLLQGLREKGPGKAARRETGSQHRPPPLPWRGRERPGYGRWHRGRAGAEERGRGRYRPLGAPCAPRPSQGAPCVSS